MRVPRWKAISESQFSWEREALEFVRERLPDHEPYRAWANFELIADNGKIYEVDLLLVTPKGFYLVEIKSRPGVIEGDSHTWTWTHEGRQVSYDNPLLLADRKAKALKSILSRQRACKKVRVPFLQPVVFCSDPKQSLRLAGGAQHWVFTRDQDATGDAPARPGIVAAVTRWSPGGPDDPGSRRVDTPTAQAIGRALDESGIRPSQRARRVGDYVLGEIIEEGPAYQDWAAEHASARGVRARVRLYPVPPEASDAARQAVQRAAEREFRILQGIRHPGILRADGFTLHERGPALIFEHDPNAVRLDHFLLQRGAALTVDLRLLLLRQIAETLRYAHEKRMIHRALSPQAILLADADGATPRVQIFNWQTGLRQGSSSASGGVTGTAHPEQLVEDAALVYMAPEVLAGNEGGEEADVFSLGAIAFHLFAGRAPADSALQRYELLRSGRGLELSSLVEGVGQQLRDLVYYSTCPEVPNRTATASDFLALLDLVEEELTEPDEEPVGDPTEAQVNDRLPGGFTVTRRLGRGSSAVTLLVKRDDAESVLKIAASADLNDRVREEAEILRKLRHARIVQFHDVLTIGDRVAIAMAKAGDETLGQRIRREGPLQAELLQRFGEELIDVARELEEVGVNHRDLKPDNIGVSEIGKKALHLVVFDFSLSRTPAENIRAGTRPYLDPFLPLRKPPRWDVQAERFAVAVTLYEMATGTLPRWGDGESDPAMIEAEASIDQELFDPALREPLSEFFARALRRDVAQRFDTCAEMLRAWRLAFERVDRDEREGKEGRRPDLTHALADVALDTQLALLPVSARVLTAMDRLQLVSVADLLRAPVMQLYGMRGVGSKTRREIRDLVASLSSRFSPEALAPVTTRGAAAASPAPDDAPEPEHASIDVLLERFLPAKAKRGESEEQILHLLLNLEEHAQDDMWPSQSEVAAARGLTRARVGQVVGKARERWAKLPLCTALRDDIVRMLDAQGGVMTARELSRAVLAVRGSAVRDEAQRARAALAVTRVAVETERERQEPRLFVRRGDGAVLIARSQELADYAERLGAVADELAATDPLPGPARVRETLEAVRRPAGAAIGSSRLPQLAAAASRQAALSSRLELYPRGLSAGRALKLAHGALLGAKQLTVAQVRARIASRYPEAEELPGHPVLDELLRDAGWDFGWDPHVNEGEGAYTTGLTLVRPTSTGSSSLSRYPTDPGSLQRLPETADADQFTQRLRHAVRQGGFLALTVRPRDLALADQVLSTHFPVERCSIESLFLSAMKAEAAAAGADWHFVLSADAALADSRDWRNLLTLARRAVPRVQEALLQPGKRLLLVYPGMLARYDALDVLQRVRDAAGRPGGPAAVWLLIPSSDQHVMPVIDDTAVPLITPGQWARIPDSWLRNLNRSGGGWEEEARRDAPRAYR